MVGPRRVPAAVPSYRELMYVAITRPTGAEIAQCELTYIGRQPINIDLAISQHAAYLATLRRIGVEVIEIPRLEHHPDAVFVEDTALVLDEIAVLLRPGAESRRGEVASIAAAVAPYREVVAVEPPAIIDGGDIIVFGRRILVGGTSRSSEAGVAALRDLVAGYGYSVEQVPVHDVLHLKSAATVVDDRTLIHYPAYVDLSFLDADLLAAPPEEPQGANVVAIGDHLLADASAPRTLELLRSLVDNVIAVDVSEFAKAEGAISCKGIVFPATP